jgi:hypothetical protein
MDVGYTVKRWHAEHAMMLRRWRMELANHEHRAPFALAPPSAAANARCHCANGVGTMRKRHVYGCPKGGRRCSCKDEKRFRIRERWRMTLADA